MSGSTLTAFTAGDLVISVYGAANGSGTYTLDQASAITLEELTPAGALVGNLVIPQATTVVGGTTEFAVSGEYGSASEGALQLSADGRSLAILGYGVSAAAFNTAGATGNSVYGNAALGQSSSLTGGVYTPVARVVADIGYNGAIDTSTALYNIYNTNNPRSVATVNGTSFYVSGQSTKGSTGQGVFEATDGSGIATPIDTSTDTREAEIYNGQLYVSRDSTQGGANGTSNIASYGATLPLSATTPSVLPGISGQVTLTAGQANSVNAGAVGTAVNISPQGFFFANPTTLYVADGGFPKEGGIGDGGLQKWTFNGTAWTLDYTLSAGLSLVPDTAVSGTTGLYGLAGSVSGDAVTLYATTSTAGELNQSYLYGITDSLSATTLPVAESFTQLAAAAPDSIIRGVALAPTAPTNTPATVTVTAANSPQTGLVVSSGSLLNVLAGGSIVSATVLSGGVAVVSGTDTNSIIGHGGSATLAGTATGDQVGGTLTVSGTNAVTSGAIIDDGGTLTVSVGSAVATTVLSGGTLNLPATGTSTNTVISGGTVVVATHNPMAINAGLLTFAGPGLLQITVAPEGLLGTVAGFGAGDIIDDTAITFAGATLSTSSTASSTYATISSGGSQLGVGFAGNVASSLSLTADAAGKAEIVFLAPPTSNVVVSAGPPVSNLIISSGSTLTVNAGGTAVSATILSSGTATIAGTDSGTTISAGGTETVLGSANADQVYGLQLVSNGTALVTNETVHSGGVVNDFLKGAILTGTTVQGGGTLNISGNTTASNTVLSAGGLINLQSPKANLTGTLTFSGAATLEETGTISAGFGDLAVISGFTGRSVIDLATLAPAGATIASAVVGGNTVVTVSGGGQSQPFTFAGTYASGFFVLGPDSNAGVQISTGVACYCQGTRILTDLGERPVETLAPGDWVVTASGALRPIKWVGRRSYAGRFAAANPDVLPVLIRSGALGDGLPRRDLFVSPMHAMFIDGLLIPAKALVNGTTIVKLTAVQQVEYVHIELDTHDILLAEGAAAESFVDDDSRALFQNAGDFTTRFPDATPAPARFCAPVVEDGTLLEPIWQRLAGRKAA